MIKVVTFNDDYSLEEDTIRKDGEEYYGYEFPVLNEYLKQGYSIKDWKMKAIDNKMFWTFILEELV